MRSVIMLLAMMAMAGCAGGGGRTLSHEETLAWVNGHRAWIVARKTRPIWVRELDAAEIGKGFQTADRAVETARSGYWLCVGVAGEPWFQAPERVASKYELAGTEEKRFAFDAAPRPYRVYRPRGDVRVWAAQVTGRDIAGFHIRPGYDPSTTLYSPAGGYVVMDAVPDPYSAPAADVWLVQQGLFESTYEQVEAAK